LWLSWVYTLCFRQDRPKTDKTETSRKSFPSPPRFTSFTTDFSHIPMAQATLTPEGDILKPSKAHQILSDPVHKIRLKSPRKSHSQHPIISGIPNDPHVTPNDPHFPTSMCRKAPHSISQPPFLSAAAMDATFRRSRDRAMPWSSWRPLHQGERLLATWEDIDKNHRKKRD